MSGLAMLPDDLVAERMDQLRADLADGTWQARHGDLVPRTPSTGACGSSIRGPTTGGRRPVGRRAVDRHAGVV